MASSKAGRSLKGFGFVPEVTACALPLGFSVGEVRVLGPHRRTVAWRKAGRSLKGFGFVPEVIVCVFDLGFSVGKVRVAFIDRLGFLPEGWSPGGRPVVP